MNPPRYLHLKEQVIHLRKQGFGYRSISNKLNNTIPWSSVRRLVIGMRSNPRLAYLMATEYSQRRPKEWNDIRTMRVRRLYLIQERGHKCESCNLSFWKNHTIPLELEHKDGCRTNNSKSNLELLCPNCHVFTPYYKGKNTSSFRSRASVV